MKYLLVLAVILVAIWIWRNNRISDSSADVPERKNPRAAPNAPVTMLACAHCGTHLPESEAIKGASGVYCSLEHRRLAEPA
jgi:uncharacterized protein